MGNNGLPYDAEIEYLKSNGTQWIDTTWTPDLTKDFRIESYAGWVTNERGMFISSFRNENNLSIELYNNRRLRVYAGKSDVVVSDTQSSLNTLYSITIEYISSSGRCTVIIDENSFIGKTNTAARILNTEAAALGTDKTHRFPYGMFGAIKIYNPNLILDLIPVRVGTTGYMYDKVSKQLFGNSGTGDFILGPDKYDAEIEYLESSGTQYIQLPLSVSSSSYFEVGGTVLTLYPNNNNYSIFGSNPYKQMMAEFYSYYSSTNENMYTSMVGGNSNSGGWRGKVGEKTDFAISTTFIKSSETIRELIRPLTDNITGFRIFASYKNDNRYPVRFCGFYIKVDDANVYDFIPVRVGQTGYLYDKVSGRLFGNAGTGKFILGSDIIMTSTSNPEVLAVCYA